MQLSARVVLLIGAVVVFAVAGVLVLPATAKALVDFGLAAFACSFLVP